MSATKKALAKQLQQYTEDPIFPQCRNCKHFARDLVEVKGAFSTGSWVQEKNLRCNLGGFKVKKLATCDKHEPQK